MTDAERALWRGLHKAFPEAHWRKQVPFGRYIADFASHGAKLIVEVDGGQHGEAVEYDAERTRFLEGEGYRVLRFWNNEVLRNLEGVLTVIQQALSPCGRGLGEGRAASAAQKNPAPVHESFERQTALAPLPLPSPTRGEGEPDKSAIWSF